MSKLGNKIWGVFEKILRFVLSGILSIFHKSMSEEQWKQFIQFVKFCFVGLSNFLISYVIYAIVVQVGGPYHLGNALGFVVSVANSYYWNNKYVFKVGENQYRSWWKSLLKTYASYAFSGLILTELLLFVEISILGLPELLGPIINLIITTPINYVINKLWAFKTKG